MSNQNVLQAFLKEKGVHCPYQIWLSSPETSDSILIEGGEHLGVFEPVHIDLMDFISTQEVKERKTYLYFKYPNQYIVSVCLSESTKFDDKEMDLMYYFLYPIYSEYALHANRYKIDKIIESICQTTSLLDIEEIFSAILKNTMGVIPTADLGTLWLYDRQLDRIVCKTSVGHVMDGLWKMKYRIGEGSIGQMFMNGTPELVKDTSKLLLKMATVSPENNQYWDSTYDFPRHVKSLISAPIAVDGEIECAMILGQVKSSKSLTEQDLHLMQGFSSQIGVALKNAKLFTDIKNQNQLLLKRDDIHSTLTNLSLQNKGAKKVIRELNRIIGKKLIFVDLIENSCIPERKKLPYSYTYQKLYRTITNMEDGLPYKIITSEQESHCLYPIRTENLILGCLIIEIKEPLSQLDHIALEQGYSVLALELVKKKNLVEFYYKNRRELYYELLQSKDSTTLLSKATELGIKEQEEFFSVILQYIGNQDEEVLDTYIHRLVAQLKKELSFYIQTIFGDHNKAIVLFCLPDSKSYPYILQILEQTIVMWNEEEKGRLLCGGISSTYSDLSLIGKSHNEAEMALSYLVSKEVPDIIEYSKIGLNRLFINQDKEEINRFLQEVFEPLQTPHHAASKLEETLITYFELNRSASQTATKLFIHINTLYQRLKKIEDCLSISFEDAEDILRLQLACYLKKSLNQAS
ncbi:GAF domain-containing protein [Pradoshia sp. D12]|uniref:helix-turn-helix domain-containing protein n=1 Tax=Bacillaceae TaxID=186817 RepID=UPI0011270E62|nr:MULTISPECIES: helix-turn-helix domain-containing protein [Bacillaceae]QFK71433.1 GAF domain-containing protein [Pradoshia sp. D12]TPF73228.1 GAF domain-containing protein [Bacillus sp. D12]